MIETSTKSDSLLMSLRLTPPRSKMFHVGVVGRCSGVSSSMKPPPHGVLPQGPLPNPPAIVQPRVRLDRTTEAVFSHLTRQPTHPAQVSALPSRKQRTLPVWARSWRNLARSEEHTSELQSRL